MGIMTIDVKNKRVLVRADLNLPMHDGRITDTTRLERLLPTLKSLQSQGACIVVISHFGRPSGAPDPTYSLAPVAALMAQHLHEPVLFLPDCIGPDIIEKTKTLAPGEFALLENLRFHPGEEANDPDFAAQLALNGDIYINDAFSASHRAHASIVGIPHHLPSMMGPQMSAEVTALESLFKNPKRPLAAIVGGAKVSTKIHLLQNLCQRADVLILGGGMANTFLHHCGVGVGASQMEAGAKDIVTDILRLAKRAHEGRGCKILLPVDACVASELKSKDKRDGEAPTFIPLANITATQRIFDIGPATIAAYTQALHRCQTVVWNGPMGVFEVPPYDRGTTQIAQCIAKETQEGKLTSIVGGGDTLAALSPTGTLPHFTHVSTAGGAFLEWLEGKELPGVAVLR